jgi:RNA polymerase primary sigma factor/RNA polymerase sigma factor
MGEELMHEDYRNNHLKELRDQLTRFAPKAKKLEQIDLAEKLYTEIDPDRTYSLEYLCFRITNFRNEKSARQNLAGVDVLHDLRLLIDDLSDSADITVEEVGQPVHTVDALSRMFRVSTKTISRWRTAGLISRRLLFGGRKRVGFLQSSVERFVNDNQDKIRRGERFSQLTDEEKGEMIERARQMVEAGATFADVTRQLAAQMCRSPETIRYTLKNFDTDHRAVAIFPSHRDVLTDDDKRAIFKLHMQGASVSTLSKRFNRNRTSINRILLDMRVEQVMELPLDHIYNEDFDSTTLNPVVRDKEFLGPVPEPAVAPRKVRVPADLPSYLAALYDVPLLTREQEYHLFRQMNYLKHKASVLRQRLSRPISSGAGTTKSSLMNEINDLYEQAVLVKNKIVQSNLRLVVSIAKRHVASTDDFFSLVSDGNMSLIRAAEKFDYSRGNKFSTYASWAIMKNFARSIPSEFKHRDRFRTTTEELFVAKQDERVDVYAQETVQKTRQRELSKILGRLDEREQKIITARFGLGRDKEPLTLKEVGAEMGVTKERIRQLEARALSKLREAADEAKIDIELGA